jgi:putative ABC transport system permease protein
VLFHLYRIRLRARAGAELLALAGIAVGVALVFAALIANASLSGAVRDLTEGIVGNADFQLSGPGASGLDRRVLMEVERLPDAAAAPVAEARVNLVGPGGRRSVLLLGGGTGSADVGGPLLRPAGPTGGRRRPGLRLPAPLAGDLGVSAGDRVAVETGRGTTRVRVADELGRGDLGRLAESPVALAPLPLVQELATMEGRISRVLVNAASGRESAVDASLRRLAGDRLVLAPADREVEVFARAASPTKQSTTLFSTLSALVGFLFALNAMLMIAPQRRRLVDDLRMAGYPPAAVVQVVLLDALLLGVAGTAAGLLLGEGFSRLLFDSTPGYLESAFAIGPQRTVTWQSAALAGAIGVLAACQSVLVPIRDSLSPSPRPEAPQAREGRRRGAAVAAATVLLALSAGMAVVVPSLSLVAIGSLLLALLLLLGAWLAAVTAAFDAVCRRLRSPVAIVAALELRAGSARARTLVLAATGAVAVYAAVSIGGARADLQRGLDGVAGDLGRGAEVWIAVRGPSNIFGTDPIALPPRQLRQIARLPAVRGISRNRGGFLDVGRDRVWVLAPERSRVPAVLRNQVEQGSAAIAERRVRRGGWVTLSERLASELDVGVGDRVDLPLPVRGRFRVAALTTDFGWPGGAIAMSAASHAGASGVPAASTLGLRLEPAARPSDVARAVRSILGAGSGLRVETVAGRVGRQRDASRAGLSRLSQISAMVLIASVLAMGASMAALVWQRRPTFAALKVDGLGEPELWRALLLEGALVVGAGCLLGALFGLAGQLVLDQALSTITGFPVVYETATRTAAGVLLLVMVSATAVLAVPGLLAVKVRPRAAAD